MFQSASPERPLKVVVAQPLLDDDDVAGTRDFDADDVLNGAMHDAFVQPFAPLTPDELAVIVANRMIIEHAVGMLVHVYDLDADNAVELLKWGSQARCITVSLLAKQLTEDLGERTDDRNGFARREHVDLRSACDDVLFTAHEPGQSRVPGTS